jgi:4-diphosphocytidyl-2-C-methyl-D-erythritol kinase
VAAPAKLNLYLHVIGRRPDGYHLLDSLVAFASAHDTVIVAPADTLELALEGPFGTALAAEADNLVLRAARLLADEAGRQPAASITLVKRLPLASGIGGGSADAAATLRALARLWGLTLDETTLMALALRLGADVPMCVAGHAAFAGGIGELLSPAPALPAAGLLLVNPGAPLSTPAVFRARTGPFSTAGRFAEAPRDVAALAALLAARGNDLTAAACALCPVIAEVLEALAGTPGCRLARMSGSGATCFGLFDDEATAAAAARIVARDGWWTAPGRLVADSGTLAAG